jgi:hypothetical protein
LAQKNYRNWLRASVKESGSLIKSTENEKKDEKKDEMKSEETEKKNIK